MFRSEKTRSSRVLPDSILSRLAYLLSAQALEGVLSTLFFLYLAWLNASDYGQIMYAMAGGAVVQTIIQFGLYYPLVSRLGNADESETRNLIISVQAIKTGLFVLCFFGVLIFGWRQNLSFELRVVLSLMSLGFSVEAVAETFFAGLRVSGKQNQEARIKVTSSLVSYGFGFATGALGLGAIYISLFKLVSGLTRIILGYKIYLKSYVGIRTFAINIDSIRSIFRVSLVFALIEILGVIYNKTNIFFLQKEAGLNGVAYYSATWNIVDAVSILGSEQFLGWVIFPLLASLWWQNRDKAGELVRRNAQWLMAIAFPIMFFLYSESSLIIGLIYPAQYSDAIWMQKFLVWTILISFQNNLFSYVMMVAGAVNSLLLFQIAGTVFNLILNFTLVPVMKLKGGCLVIIFTKLFIACLTFGYCRVRFHFVGFKNFLFPISLGLVSLGLFISLNKLINLHFAVGLTLIFYLGLLFVFGPRFIGSFPRKIN
ncbi:MAG: oligosaccharide flippase family protein [Desulfomonilaceae bacterium]